MSASKGTSIHNHSWVAHWLCFTIIGTFLPVIISCIILFFKNNNICIKQVVENGEVVLTSGIISWSVFDEFNESDSCIKKHRFVYYILLIAIVIEFITFAIINVKAYTSINSVWISSTLIFISTLGISFVAEKRIYEEQ